nr:PREDICTED: uncharacterized protein LOC109032563 [Bemisia tabaci]
MSSNVEYRCATCHKSENEVPLLRCSRCKRERYCSRECQRANWREHKSDCSDDGQGSILNPFAVLDGTWFSNRPKHEVFKLLIDVYKMKIEDEYVFEGDVDEDSVYGGASPGTAAQHFRKYLTLITRIDARRAPQSRILPHWWSRGMITENVNYALKEGWSFIGYAIEKSDVIDHYKNPLMPMQLRAMREQLEGPDSDSE